MISIKEYLAIRIEPKERDERRKVKSQVVRYIINEDELTEDHLIYLI